MNVILIVGADAQPTEADIAEVLERYAEVQGVPVESINAQVRIEPNRGDTLRLERNEPRPSKVRVYGGRKHTRYTR